MRASIVIYILVSFAFLLSVAAAADSDPPSINAYGETGLIEVPTAFMPADGTFWLGASRALTSGYRHVFVGLQPLPWFEATVRHSAFGGRGSGNFDLLAADVKVRLRSESAHWPQLAVGARGLFGSGRQAGEYLVASRRFRWGEATFGIGWGRFAGDGRLPNPLQVFGSTFREDRPDRRGSASAGVTDLFTGEKIGLFGGVSLRMPWRGLRLQIDYSADDFVFEQRADPDFDVRLPVNVGLIWQPIDGLQLGVAIERGDRAMLRLAIGGNPGALPLQAGAGDPPPIRQRERAPAAVDLAAIAETLAGAGIVASAIGQEDRRLGVWIDAEAVQSPAQQIGRAARVLTGAAPRSVAAFDLTLVSRGFHPTAVSLMRGDVERAGRHAGSAEEIWRDVVLSPAGSADDADVVGYGVGAEGWVTLRGAFGLEAPEADTLYRLSLLTEARLRHRSGFFFAGGARLALTDNLTAPDSRERLVIPVRSDRVLFADGPPIRLERGYVGRRWQTASDLFAETAIGYLEEAYAGLRTEVLWRPFGRRVAVSLDTMHGFRRDPASQWRLFPTLTETAHLNLYWRPPSTTLTAQLSAGRYLAGDLGATARVWRDFDNGVRVDAWATASSAGPGDDILTGGVALVLPLQRLLPILPRSYADLRLTPLLRDSGQRLDWPHDVYALTDPASFEAITGRWRHLLE